MLTDGRLFNESHNMNFGQEGEIQKRLAVRRKGSGVKAYYLLNDFVYHFRGQTLGGCQNGHKDCATWQQDHRADATYHISKYSEPKYQPRRIPWWEPHWD